MQAVYKTVRHVCIFMKTEYKHARVVPAQHAKFPAQADDCIFIMGANWCVTGMFDWRTTVQKVMYSYTALMSVHVHECQSMWWN